MLVGLGTGLLLKLLPLPPVEVGAGAPQTDGVGCQAKRFALNGLEDVLGDTDGIEDHLRQHRSIANIAQKGIDDVDQHAAACVHQDGTTLRLISDELDTGYGARIEHLVDGLRVAHRAGILGHRLVLADQTGPSRAIVAGPSFLVKNNRVLRCCGH